jgi:hypothetical protein
MRFELRRLTDYSEDALLAEIRRVAQLVDRPKLSQSEFRKHSRASWSTVSRRFGSWEEALRRAGLAGRVDSSNKPVGKEEVLAELRRVGSLLGDQVFTAKQFAAQGRFTDAAVRKHFGTWHKAMQATGMAASPFGKRYSDDECFENLLAVWSHYGRPPQHREMKVPPSVVGPKAYVRRWGTWTKALHAFAERVNSDIQDADGADVPSSAQQTALVVPPRPLLLDERGPRDIPLGLRYTVLKRDRFRCVLCGSSPATSHDCRLHVDHIVPFAKGGKTTVSNLRTLCESCNLGKGARIENLEAEPGDPLDARKDARA